MLDFQSIKNSSSHGASKKHRDSDDSGETHSEKFVTTPRRDIIHDAKILSMFSPCEITLISRIAKQYGVHLSNIIGNGRWSPYVKARHNVWYELNRIDAKLYGVTNLGYMFGKHRTTIRYGIETHKIEIGVSALSANRKVG